MTPGREHLPYQHPRLCGLVSPPPKGGADPSAGPTQCRKFRPPGESFDLEPPFSRQLSTAGRSRPPTRADIQSTFVIGK
jgi:hypothetical protein